MNINASTIIVDAEFRDLIPPLTPDEREGLEADILCDGCLDRLKIWHTEEGDVLIDGHNRKEICDRHGFPYETESIPGLESRDDVKKWIIQHQRHRRNLNETQRAMLAGMLADVERGGGRGNQYTGGKVQICALTQDKVAEQFNVSRRSVQHARKVHERGIPELTRLVTAGKASVSAAAEVARLPQERQREIVAGGPEAVQEASRNLRQSDEDYTAGDAVPETVIPDAAALVASELVMSADGLYPCGHCGGAAEAKQDFDIFNGARYYVICNGEGCNIQTPMLKSREEVIAIWNRRGN